MGTAVGVGDAGGVAMVPVAPAGEGLGESPGKAWGVLMRVSEGYMPSAGVAAKANTDDISVLRMQCFHSGLCFPSFCTSQANVCTPGRMRYSLRACLQLQSALRTVSWRLLRLVWQ